MEQMSLSDIGVTAIDRPHRPIFVRIPSRVLGFCPICHTKVYYGNPIPNAPLEDIWNCLDIENRGKKMCPTCNEKFDEDSDVPEDVVSISGLDIESYLDSVSPLFFTKRRKKKK